MNRLSHIGVSMLLATSAFSVGAQEVVDRVSQETDKCLDSQITLVQRSNCQLEKLNQKSEPIGEQILRQQRANLQTFLTNTIVSYRFTLEGGTDGRATPVYNFSEKTTLKPIFNRNGVLLNLEHRF